MKNFLLLFMAFTGALLMLWGFEKSNILIIFLGLSWGIAPLIIETCVIRKKYNEYLKTKKE